MEAFKGLKNHLVEIVLQEGSRCPEWGQFTKKLPGYDTYFFEKGIPLGIQKRPNENIRCVA